MQSSPPLSPTHSARAHARPLAPSVAGISCPSFPTPTTSAPSPPPTSVPQPPLSRVSLSAAPCSRLPPLDLSNLTAGDSAVPAAPSPLTNAHSHVDRISNTLSRIRPHLYVGSQQALFHSSTSSPSIAPALTHVITFASTQTPKVDRLYSVHADDLSRNSTCSTSTTNFVSIAFPIRDDAFQCIDHIFLPVKSLIDQAAARNGCIALICAQGISRSAACAIAYLMITEGLTVDEALSDLRAARPIVAPNAGFMNSLYALQNKLRFGLKVDSISVVRPIASPGAPPHPDLHRRFFADEKLKYESAANSVFNRPFVPLPASHVLRHEFSEHKAVAIVEKRARRGVMVWFGSQADRESQLAGQRIGRMLAKQQEIDQRTYGVKAFGDGEHAEAIGRVSVIVQGQFPRLDEGVKGAVESRQHSVNVDMDVS